MALNEQEKKQIITKAQEYIELEQEALFRNEVVNALDEEAFDDLYDRFYTSLTFGTAGMRGIIGGGSNRINPYMIRKVTQGFSDYLLKEFKKPTVVIAFDSRNYSELFARQAALNLCANGITVSLYYSIRPVPMLSFALRYLKADAGIVITASHNPAKYNGYKVYWSHGGQVTEPHDKQIVECVNKVDPTLIKNISYAEALEKGLLKPVVEEVDEAYYNMVLDSLKQKELFADTAIKVAYTPLHGSGNIPVRTLLERLEVECEVVEQQELPDGNFPTVSMPNPEDHQAMRLAIELATKIKADLVLGTDPDADRLGIAIPSDETKNNYTLLNGNQIAVLLCDYLLNSAKSKKQPVVVKSIVTTDLIKKITEAHKGVCYDVLTGFKFIAEKIAALENSKEQYFLFGAEESYGYLYLSQIRDKDAVSSAILATEMVAYYKKQNITLQQRLDQIYKEYGYYTENVLSFSYEGFDGQNKMASIMASFRNLNVGDSFANNLIIKTEDLLKGEGELPPSDVVILNFESGDKMVIRPSGTEPKIKYYLFFQTDYDNRGAFEQQMQQKTESIKAEL